MADAQSQFRALVGAGEFRQRWPAEIKPIRVEWTEGFGVMSNRLQNKIALVTAAGQGIGRAIAEAFIAEGANVIATDLAEDKLGDLKANVRKKLDVRAQDNIDTLAKDVGKEFGALDILVNCAGYVHQGTIFDCTDKDWDFSFDLNVKSMHRMIKTFLPPMLEKKKG